MNNIFYIIGVVVVVLFIAGYFGLRSERSDEGLPIILSKLSNTGSLSGKTANCEPKRSGFHFDGFSQSAFEEDYGHDTGLFLSLVQHFI